MAIGMHRENVDDAVDEWSMSQMHLHDPNDDLCNIMSNALADCCCTGCRCIASLATEHVQTGIRHLTIA